MSIHKRLSHVAGIVLIGAVASMIALPASAGGHRDGYYGKHGGYSHHRGYNRGYHRGYDRAYHRGYKRGYRHHGRHYRRHHDRNAAYLLGGIVLGSVITHAVSAPRYHRPAYSHRDVVVVDRPTTVRSYRTPVSTSAPIGRSLYRDIDGNCFERRSDADGNELLEELPAAACDW